jgi:hypothetical protein
MTHGLVPVAPTSVDVVLIGVDEGARRDGGLNDGSDRLLLDIGQHLQHDLTTALDQPEDRRLFFC